MFSNQIHPPLDQNPFLEAARRWLRRNWTNLVRKGENAESIAEQLKYEFGLSDEDSAGLIEETEDVLYPLP